MNLIEVFASYSQPYDRDDVHRLTENLEKKGIKVVTYSGDAAPGTDKWKQSMREIMHETVAALCFVSPNISETNYVDRELEFVDIYKRSVYPLRIAGDDWDALAPEVLKERRFFDLRGDHYLEGLSELTAILLARHAPPEPDTLSVPTDQGSHTVQGSQNSAVFSFLKPILWFGKALKDYFISKKTAATIPMEETASQEPYKGLRPFTEDDAKYFFGRDPLIEEIVDRIIKLTEWQPDAEPTLRFLGIVGSSGSGKSSLVMAGVMPRLQRRKQQGRHWFSLTPIRPGESPLTALAHTLSPHLPKESEDTLVKNLRSKPKSLKTYTEWIYTRKNCNLVLYIDQFEELFTMTFEEEERQQFILLLRSVAHDSSRRVFVIITLRADFYDRLLENPRLAVMFAPQTQMISVPAMSIPQLRETIEKPAQLANLEFEGDLVAELLNDIAQQRDALPLLQFTLKKLYDQSSDQHILTMQAYKKLSGVSGALDQYADDIYLGNLLGQSLTSDKQREMARYLFCSLININDSIQNATRRRVPISYFQLSDEEDKQVMKEIIEIFVNARLLTTDGPIRLTMTERANLEDGQGEGEAATNEATLEISHEALIRVWRRLHDWAEESQDEMRVEQGLIIDTKKWEDHEKRKNLLSSGKDLKKALAWANRNKPNMRIREYLQKSQKHQRNKKMRVGIVALILVGILFYFFTPIFNYVLNNYNIVTNTNDDGPGSMRQILHSASANSVIRFSPTVHGQITLGSDLVFTQNVTISGPSQGDIQISAGSSQHRIIISANSSVILEHLVFTGAVIYSSSFITNQGNLTLNQCHIHHNKTVSDGGGVTNIAGTLTVSDTIIEDNTASGNGGGIYSKGGVVNVNNSQIDGNMSEHSGGGIDSMRGTTLVNNSHIWGNHAKDGSGGGIDVFNGILIFTASDAQTNDSSTYGGGIAVVGSQATISAANITKNTAQLYGGGGLAVVKDSENNMPAQITTNTVDLTGKNANAHYTILYNEVKQPLLKPGTQNIQNILGSDAVISGKTEQIFSDGTNYRQGNPASAFAPEQDLGSKYYLGTADLDTFCQSKSYSYGSLSEDKDFNATDIQIKCFTQTGTSSKESFPAQKACQEAFRDNQDVFDRLANYNDQSSLQCYGNVKILGPILTVDNVQRYCQHVYHTDVDNNFRQTAYDWNCKQSNNNLPSGFAVTDVCQFIYNPQAFDRLINYNRPDGWECLAPK